MTLGVRGLVLDRENRTIFLIRHTYVPGWQLPGGGVETGETVAEALEKEMAEEGNIRILARPRLFAIYFNRHVSRRDHVALFVIETFAQTAPKLPDREIAESGFFPLDALPAGTTAATRRRIAEVMGEREATGDW